ncbi:hypothetical protein AYO22_07150 [Fonsecaea multimorphosa]|nr:hypothetical protein AYO22_07150 [Fonsecaea multimorphosa]
MQDNAPIHKVKKVMDWFEDNGITVLDWPPFSPDLNPIESLWFELKRLVNEIDPGLKDTTGDSEALRQRFVSAITRAWASISPGKIKAVVKSMDNRINAIIAAEGWYTRY